MQMLNEGSQGGNGVFTQVEKVWMVFREKETETVNVRRSWKFIKEGNRRKWQHDVDDEQRFDLVTLFGLRFDNQKAARRAGKSENEITSDDQTFRAGSYL